MRHCINESVEVHEGYGEELAPLLRDAADLIDQHEGLSNITTQYGQEGMYLVTVYLH